jgi:hypothetical protein
MLRSADVDCYVSPAADALIGRRGASSPETQQRLKGSHGGLSPVMPKHELVQVGLELPPSDAMMHSHEPLLEISDRGPPEG